MAFLLRAFVWLLPFALYAASPFATAWTLKEAITAGNAPVIDALVEWDSVRLSLRRSMTALALDRPMDFQSPPAPPLGQPSNGPKAGFWQRVKSYFGTAAVDRLINRYANAEGLPALFTYGQAYKRYVRSVDEPPKTLSNLPLRMSEFWSRLRHAAFVTPAVFEIEMADRSDPSRRFTGIFVFRDMHWKLTELYVHTDANPLRRTATVTALNARLER
jgi:hypothetical protein